MGIYNIAGMKITAKNLNDAIKKRAEIDIKKEKRETQEITKDKKKNDLMDVERQINKIAFGY